MDKIQELQNQIADLKSVLLDTIKYVNQGFNSVDANFEAMGKSIKTIDKKVDILIQESGQVGEKIDELTVEVSKIQKVSNYSAEYENLLKISK